MSTTHAEEDLYGFNNTTEVPGRCSAVQYAPRPWGHWASPETIDRFWRATLRPLRNEGCDALEIGSHMASVTATDMETCIVAPHPELKQSHVLLRGEDGVYEWTPRPLPEGAPSVFISLGLGLGLSPVSEMESCVPENFNLLKPFRITQTPEYFYIEQSLTTRAISRLYKIHPNWDHLSQTSMVLTFSNLVFSVKYTACP